MRYRQNLCKRMRKKRKKHNKMIFFRKRLHKISK